MDLKLAKGVVFGVAGMIGLAFGIAIGIGLGIVAVILGYSYLATRIHAPKVASVQTAATPKPALADELLKRQRAAALQGGELDWLKKRTGIDCSVAVSDAECLPVLNTLSTEEDILSRVRMLQGTGVKVLVSKRSPYLALEPDEHKPLPTGEISEDGTLIFIYREATVAEIRAYLLR